MVPRYLEEYLICLLNIKMAVEGLLVCDPLPNHAQLILCEHHEADVLLNPLNSCPALQKSDWMSETCRRATLSIQRFVDVILLQVECQMANRKRKYTKDEYH